MAAKLWVGEATEGLLPGYINLSDSHYAGETVNDVNIVRWRHLDPQIGPSTAVEMVNGEEHVGRMWIQVHPWSVAGKQVRAANPIDFLIREDNRGLPSFLSLFKRTMKEAGDRSDVIFHTSNPLTDDLYRKLMKFEPVTELDGAVIPLRPFALAKASEIVNAKLIGAAGDWLWGVFVRLFGAVAALTGVRLVDSVDDASQDQLIAQHVAQQDVTGSRTRAFRQWRFKGAGILHYEQSWIVKDGKVLGYVVTSDRDVNGIRGRFVVDLVIPGRRPRLVATLVWLQLASRSVAAKRDALFFFYNRKNQRLRQLASFPAVTVPRSRLPQQVPIFVRSTTQTDPAMFESVDWSTGYYVLSDLDLF